MRCHSADSGIRRNLLLVQVCLVAVVCLRASAAGAEPVAYVLVHPVPSDDSTELRLLDLASGDLEPIGPLGVVLVDPRVALSADGVLYAVDFQRFDVPTPRIDIYRLDAKTGAADRIAQRELGESILFFRGLTVDSLGDLWLLFARGPSADRFLLFRFDTARLELIQDRSLLGGFRGLAHRDARLWTVHFPTQPSSAPLAPPAGPFLGTLSFTAPGVTLRTPLERIIEPGLSFDSRGRLWGLLSRGSSLRPDGFPLEAVRLDPKTGAVESRFVRIVGAEEAVYPGSLAVVPGLAAPGVPTLGAAGLIGLIVLLLAAGVFRLHTLRVPRSPIALPLDLAAPPSAAGSAGVGSGPGSAGAERRAARSRPAPGPSGETPRPAPHRWPVREPRRTRCR